MREMPRPDEEHWLELRASPPLVYGLSGDRL
jgi:hypothetical protein